MRIRQLDLLRYGKFTDRDLQFPAAGRDFHMIVGANEAGKSTTRSAILDLLFGINHVTAYDFLHARETRLGATLEHGGAELAFVRTKAIKQSLFDAAGAPLAESALGPFLATTDRAFFEQMFGLDHPRLVAGGKDILSASSDVGQILFQSAAGIGSLGTVRDQLAAEADKLWARRKSGERAYYVAAEQLARADAALKAATVRTRDWLDMRTRLQELDDRRALLHERHRVLETERGRLERVRRVASALRRLREHEAEVRQLGDTVLLPPDAARRLADTELELAGAERDRQLQLDAAAAARAQHARIRIDERIVRNETDIVALAERRQQVRDHPRDIERRRIEIDVHWQQVVALARQLGWPALTEEALDHKLPGLPARTEVAALIKRFEMIDQTQRSATTAAADTATELQVLQAQLDGLTLRTAPPALRAALHTARGLGDTALGLRRAEALVERTRRELAAALAGLGGPVDIKPGIEALRAVDLPSANDIRQRQQRHADAVNQRKALAERQTELDAEIDLQRLEITQYRNAHQPVGLSELAEARSRRDVLWQAVKSGTKPLAVAAEPFERELRAADGLADRRHDTAHQVTELQSRLDGLQRLQLQAADNAARRVANDAELARLNADWAAVSAAFGLPGLALQDVETWRAARDEVLRSADADDDARRERDAVRLSIRDSGAALAAALADASVAFDANAGVDTLVLTAAEAVDTATAAQARLDELGKQRQQTAVMLGRRREQAAAAQAQQEAWTAAWQAATTGIGLQGAVEVATADAALDLLSQIDATLKNMRELRRNHVEAMQRDLADFEREAAALAEDAAPDLAGQPGPAIATGTAVRLAAALAGRGDAARLEEAVALHDAQAASAVIRIDDARAVLQPLLQQAGVDNLDALREAIARSDRRRQLDDAAAEARQTVDEGGDGLPLDALEAEIAATDASRIPVLVADIGLQIDSLRIEQDSVTAELTRATGQLAAIAGQDDAARAEAARQDALAQMANAAERYIKVHTASRLLKWAIDRYRETRQGPMLGRAGEVFAMLTLGSFCKLVVEFDSDPLLLQGLRAEGELVGVDGMSDGTRDQLYLALRLAALELHLQHGHALPFIADDLFINFDDRRSEAGLQALARLSEQTQVIFLSHHDHLVPTVQKVFGGGVNVIGL